MIWQQSRAAVLAAWLLAPLCLHAQPADMVLVNGRIITLDPQSTVAEAVAIRGGSLLATGPSVTIRALAGPATQVIDLGGRTVIPGLIDSHLHAIRAALFYATEVNWIGTHSIPEAMRRIQAAAASTPAEQWIIVAGGWTEQQFREARRPSQAEIAAAAPGRLIYIQHFYDAVLLSPAAFQAFGIPPTDGEAAGWIEGNNAAITGLFDKLPLPSFAQSVHGTRLFFRELNRLGLTGVLDPGGYNIAPASYQPLFQVWRARQLTLRVRFSLFAQRPGQELEDLQSLTQMLPMGFGDGMLRFNGIGENVAWGMYNNEAPTEAQKQHYYDIAAWAAARGMTLTQHWNNNGSVHHLLDVFERVNRDTPIAPLRWSIAHVNDATPETLARMKALGVGWTMQDAAYFEGERMQKRLGTEGMLAVPPMMTAARMGINVGGGTDAHRVNTYNPFVSLQWMLDGKTVAGMATRGAAEIPTREQALRFYTLGSAWFTFDETRRGSLEPGKLADLAVLDQDYMQAPVEQIGETQSLLTMVGGRVVYAAGPFAQLEHASSD